MSRLKMLSMMNLRILRIALTDSLHFNGKNIREREKHKDVAQWASKVASEAE